MYILGVSCFYHDSSACLIRDGQVLAAAQEERFSRVKNTGAFPIEAIHFCLRQAGISMAQIDHVAYFEKPFLKFSRVIVDHLLEWPMSLNSFCRSIPNWLAERLTLPSALETQLGYTGKISYLKHHLSHAASAFYPSPFAEAAIITADGVGEWATFSVGTGLGSKIEIEKEIHYPNSLGLLYTAVTAFLGFDANGEEGKTMGLAGYGDPTVYANAMRDVLMLRDDGSFTLNQKYFLFRSGRRMWSRHWQNIFGPPRSSVAPFEQRHYDLAAACQAAVENVMVLNARVLQQRTGLKKICLAGGVTLNCLANMKVLEQAGFDEIFVQPAAGDAGGALGAALYVYHSLYQKNDRVAQAHTFWGPQFSDDEIRNELVRAKLDFTEAGEDLLCSEVARAVCENLTVGWFQGRMEFGPRALGHRSILGNAAFAGMKELLNSRIKKREAFRPFAPIVLAEFASEYFELATESPYMLLAPHIRKNMRSAIPAVVHVDGTARVQTCDQKSDPKLYKLISEVKKIAGVPVIINTSFNRRGEPVVCTPADAIKCYLETQMDVLAIGPFLAKKKGAIS